MSRGSRFPGSGRSEETLLRSMLQRGVNAPVCTSLGRIFDAAAALLGLVVESLYEGEGPIRLEGLALPAEARAGSSRTFAEAERLLPLRAVRTGDGRIFIADPRPLLEKVLAEGAGGAAGRDTIARLALLFHQAVAAASLEGARRMRTKTGVSRLVLSGGVFQNLLLREILVPPLIKEGFEVFLNLKAPPGDGGLSVGQAWFEERQG